MDKYDKILSNLNDQVLRSNNHSEVAGNYTKIIEAFEMKIYSAPLIGCGAGLILYASAFRTTDINKDVYVGLLFGSWFFFLGVCLAVLGGVSYIQNMSNWKDESIDRNNSQNIFIDLHKSLNEERKAGKKLKLLNFTQSAIGRFDEMLTLDKSAERHAVLGGRWVILARTLIFFSGLFFVVGVSIPLTILSLG